VKRPPLFVYGTLLSGEVNHHLLAGARFLGEAESAPAFELVDLGSFPGLVSGFATAVQGELYAVPPPLLAVLDDFEGHPRFYRRHRIRLGHGVLAEAYLLDREQTASLPRISSGSWRARAIPRPT
jgi:gamma-glutamylcyclotransferase (GGCT)/AIG2-like uncharacterized protein YtfP